MMARRCAGGRFLHAEEARNPHEIHLKAVDVIIEALLRDEGEDALAHLRHRPVQGPFRPTGQVRPIRHSRMLDVKTGDRMDALHIARDIDVLHVMGIVEPHRDKGCLPGLAAAVDEHLEDVAAIGDEPMDRGHLEGIVPRVALEVLLPPAHVLGHRVDLALVPGHAAVGHGEKMGVHLARDLVDRGLKDLWGPRLAPLVIGARAGDVVGRVVVEEHPIGRPARRPGQGGGAGRRNEVEPVQGPLPKANRTDSLDKTAPVEFEGIFCVHCERGVVRAAHIRPLRAWGDRPAAP